VKRDTGVAGQMFDFTRSQKNVSSDVLNELNRLADTGNTPSLSKPDASTRVRSLKKQIGEQEYQSFLQYYGDELKTQFSDQISGYDYRDATDEEKKKLLDNIKSDALDDALNQFGYQSK
jgi:hypothetical protein